MDTQSNHHHDHNAKGGVKGAPNINVFASDEGGDFGISNININNN